MKFPGKLNQESYCQMVAERFQDQFTDFRSDEIAFCATRTANHLVYIFDHKSVIGEEKRRILTAIANSDKMDDKGADEFEATLNSNIKDWFDFAFCLEHCKKYPDSSSVTFIIKKLNPTQDPEKLERCFDLISTIAIYCTKELVEENLKSITREQVSWVDKVGGSRVSLAEIREFEVIDGERTRAAKAQKEMIEGFAATEKPCGAQRK